MKTHDQIFQLKTENITMSIDFAYVFLQNVMSPDFLTGDPCYKFCFHHFCF